MTILNLPVATPVASTRPTAAAPAGDEKSIDAFAAIMSSAIAVLAEVTTAAPGGDAELPSEPEETPESAASTQPATNPVGLPQSTQVALVPEASSGDRPTPIPATGAEAWTELDATAPDSTPLGTRPRADEPAAPTAAPPVLRRAAVNDDGTPSAPPLTTADEPAGEPTATRVAAPTPASVAPVHGEAAPTPISASGTTNASGQSAPAQPAAAPPAETVEPPPAAPITPVTQPVSPPTVAVASAVPAQRPVPFAGQVLTPIVTLARAPHGDHVVTVTVTPENLGPVTVRAHVGPDGVRVELFAPLDVGRDALRAILPDLRRDLAATGLQAQLDVSAQSEPDARDRQREEPGGNLPGRLADKPATADTPLRSEPHPAQLTSILDVIA
ncbi:flagellar hook-length control protein FliK [Cryobacterium sp. BB736]|uniref:flagellar hook-length control protein FliK n=1 Tax=Cryobacterium sp. BB736 TaxID=2746963 RepID=UPI00187665C8|nr:flagellar hook-length control protein FliK [Cryobacterium sp. BB736]